MFFNFTCRRRSTHCREQTFVESSTTYYIIDVKKYVPYITYISTELRLKLICVIFGKYLLDLENQIVKTVIKINTLRIYNINRRFPFKNPNSKAETVLIIYKGGG